jgi:TPR repeat protein
MIGPTNQIFSEGPAVSALEVPQGDQVSAESAASSCPSCNFALAARSQLARFCPQCGTPLARGDFHPAEFVPFARRFDAVQSAAANWIMLRDRRGEKPAAMGPISFAHPLMLLGYANAMYRLGWRYETGDGTGRNVDEAIRCYFKAAKLGNPAALSRLAPECTREGPIQNPSTTVE